MKRPKDGKKPKSMTDEVWEKFKGLRRSFFDALKDEDEAKINLILEAHPDNQRPADDHNEASVHIHWESCPLWTTAAYYANNVLEISKMPIYRAEEIYGILRKEEG